MAGSSSTFIVDIIINLIITLVFYGAGPMLLAKKRKGLISKGRLKLFSVIYTFLVWVLIFCLFNALVLGEQVSSGAPAVLWGVVFYRSEEKNFYNAKLGLPIHVVSKSNDINYIPVWKIDAL